MHPIALKIRQIRLEKGLKMAACGIRAGFKNPYQEWRQLECLPNRQHFTTTTLLRAAKGLDVPVEILLSEEHYTQTTKPRARAG